MNKVNKLQALLLVLIMATGSWIRVVGLPGDLLWLGRPAWSSYITISIWSWLIILASTVVLIGAYETLASRGWWRGGLISMVLIAFSPIMVQLSRSSDGTSLVSVATVVIVLIAIRQLHTLRCTNVAKQEIFSCMLLLLLSALIIGGRNIQTRIVLSAVLPIVSILIGMLWEILSTLKKRIAVLVLIAGGCMVILSWANRSRVPLFFQLSEQQHIVNTVQLLNLKQAQFRWLDTAGAIELLPIMSTEKIQAHNSNTLDWAQPIVFLSEQHWLDNYPSMIVIPFTSYLMYVYIP